MVRLINHEIQLDDDGFPKSNEFYFPILDIINENNFIEEEIIEELKDYFNLSSEQINQKVTPRSESNNTPSSKLQSRAHFAIADFERLNFIKNENRKNFLTNKGEYILNNGIYKLSKSKLENASGKLDLLEVLCCLSNFNFDMSFLHLTSTGLDKSIMDATEHVRIFLKRNELHDFDSQGNGADYKEFIPSCLFTLDKMITFESSAYKTARGDRRMWFNTVDKSLLKAGSIFLICTDNELLYFFNLSDEFVKDSLLNKKGKIYEILKELSNNNYNNYNNSKLLFNCFKKINNKRYILVNDNIKIEEILYEEGIVKIEGLNRFSFDGIKFELSNKFHYSNHENEWVILNNLEMGNLNNFGSLIEFKDNYFPNENKLNLNNKIDINKLKLEIDYLNGTFKVFDNERKIDIIVWDLENILKGSEENFNLIYKDINVNNGKYVLFNKLICFSKYNFSLLTFFILDKNFEANLGIDIELLLDIDINEDFHDFTLKLKMTDENIIKNLFCPKVYELNLMLSDYF